MKKILLILTLMLFVGCGDDGVSSNEIDYSSSSIYYEPIKSSSSMKLASSSSINVQPIYSSSSSDYCTNEGTKLKNLDDLSICMYHDDFVIKCDNWFRNKTGVSFIDYCLYVLDDTIPAQPSIPSSQPVNNKVTIKPVSCQRTLTCEGNSSIIQNCVNTVQSRAAANGTSFSSGTCTKIMNTCNCY